MWQSAAHNNNVVVGTSLLWAPRSLRADHTNYCSGASQPVSVRKRIACFSFYAAISFPPGDHLRTPLCKCNYRF
jgi:hypothetical protein